MPALMSTRLIPREPEAQPTLFDVAMAQRWKYVERVKADPDRMIPGESIFQPADLAATAHYVDDFIANAKYVLLKSESLEALQKLADIIYDEMDVWFLDEILELYPAAKNEEERITAIGLTALAAPGAMDPRFLEILKAAYSASEPRVREKAVRMTAYVGWPELLAQLTPLQNDPDEKVRDRASAVVAAMTQRPTG